VGRFRIRKERARAVTSACADISIRRHPSCYDSKAASRQRLVGVQPPAITLATRAAWESHELFLGTAACDCTCECGGNVGIPQDMRETRKSACIPSTFPQDQRVDPNLVALLGLALPENGAGDGNRTHGSSLGSLGITIIRRPPPAHCSPMVMRAAITRAFVRDVPHAGKFTYGATRGTG
jgi:hypothetical protein